MGHSAAQRRAKPDLAGDYLQHGAELAAALQRLTAARERYAREGGATLMQNLLQLWEAARDLHQQLQALAPLEVHAEVQRNEFEDLLWGARGGDGVGEELSLTLRNEIGAALRRYPREVERTDTLLRDGAQAREQVREQVRALLAAIAAAEQPVQAERDGIARQVQALIMALVALVLAGGSGLLWLQRRLGAAIGEVDTHLARLAQGDLREPLQLHSRIRELASLSQSTALLQRNLVGLITGLQGDSSRVAEVADSVLDNARGLADSTGHQRQQSLQASAAVEQMTAASAAMAGEASAARGAAASAGEALEDGRASVLRSAEAMAELGSEIAGAGRALKVLQQETERIHAFVAHIQAIADQTNLLALNAAIEAARAGGQGRGFAVVADEVRTLAQRSGEATREIQHLVEGIGASSSQLGAVMAQQQESAARAVADSRDASDRHDLLAEQMERIRDAIAVIAEQASAQHQASEELALFVREVNDAAEQAAERSAGSVGQAAVLRDIGAEVAKQAHRFTI
jgi:methyl-accepting chemotaxis protein